MTDKFCNLLHTSLVTLSQMLEIATLEDIGKYADEILQYLKSTVTLEPTESIRCVQQVHDKQDSQKLLLCQVCSLVL